MRRLDTCTSRCDWRPEIGLETHDSPCWSRQAKRLIAERDELAREVERLRAALRVVRHAVETYLREYGDTDGLLEDALAAAAGGSQEGQPEPYCTETQHIVLPSGEACVCGDNQTELLL